MGELMSALIGGTGIAHAPQQPRWKDHPDLPAVLETLRQVPDVIAPTQLPDLRLALSQVANGEATVLQIGDCAEDPRLSSERDVHAKVAFYNDAANVFASGTAHVVGRIAGQYAKPRSNDMEPHLTGQIPSFRGTMVNDPTATQAAREHVPRRMLEAHSLSFDIARHIATGEKGRGGANRVWTSHEALILDYEMMLVRRSCVTGNSYLSSTHLPWIGQRTNDPDGVHARLLAEVSNPVGVKLGPEDGPDRALAIAQRLDPAREPGRLVLIVRCGDDYESVESVMRAVRRAGHPAVWMCDPMHGNTVAARDGTKTRCVDAILREIERFVRAARASGVQAGGLHLEASHLLVAECADRGFSAPSKGVATSLCDPRLNPEQTLDVTSTWRRLLEGE